MYLQVEPYFDTMKNQIKSSSPGPGMGIVDYLANRYCQQLQVQVRNEVKCGEINTSRPFWTLK